MNLLHVPFFKLSQKIGCKSLKGGKENTMTDFSVADVQEMIGDGLCAYTGNEFSSLHNATFERINPCKGYVQGNVIMVSSEANGHKASLDAFVKGECIPDAMKVKLLRKAIYQLEKKIHTE